MTCIQYFIKKNLTTMWKTMAKVKLAPQYYLSTISFCWDGWKLLDLAGLHDWH